MESESRTEPDDLELEATEASFLFSGYQQLLGDHGQPFPGVMGYQLQLPSFADSTSYTSEISDPALNQESTLPTAFDGVSTDDSRPSQYDVDQEPGTQPFHDPSTHNLDLQYIGVAPQILVNGQLLRPLMLPADDELSTNLVPNGSTRPFDGDYHLASALTSCADADRTSSAGSSNLDMIDTPNSSVGLSRTSSQSSSRGRRRRLSREGRERAADMRHIKSCDRCRIRRVKVRSQESHVVFKMGAFYTNSGFSVTQASHVSIAPKAFHVTRSFVYAKGYLKSSRDKDKEVWSPLMATIL